MQEYLKRPNLKYALSAFVALAALLTFFNILPFFIGGPLMVIGGLAVAKLFGLKIDVLHDPDSTTNGDGTKDRDGR